MDETSGQPKIIVHGRAKNNRGEEIDVSTLIERSGCSEVYYQLEDCLGENDRDWRKCQSSVNAWRACYDKQQADKRRQLSQAAIPPK